jgi:hypothetical protein
VPEEEEYGLEKTFPGLLTVKEGVANEAIIDAELKHLFKGDLVGESKKCMKMSLFYISLMKS